MNSSQLLAVLVCVLFAFVYSAPVADSLKADDVSRYLEEQGRQMEEALRDQGYPLYDNDAAPPMDKRAQTFVRFGKRAQTFVRFGKRAQTFVRFG